MHRRRAPLAAGLLGLAVAGCGQAVVLPGPTAQTVTRFVVTHTGYRPPDVRCPSDVPAKVGRTFTCRFTGPDGKYEAVLRILSVHGSRVNYSIRSEIVERAVLVGSAEREIRDFVYRHTRFRPTDVRCPGGVLAHVGAQYQCHFTGPDGTYTAYVTITAVGASAATHIVTRRTGP
jgi:hypothetical protein